MSKAEKSAVTIRPMARNDIHDVLAFDRRVNEGRSVLNHKDMAVMDPGGPLDLSFVAEVNGTLVGFIISRLMYLMIPFTEVCIIQGAIVDPDYREQGIGSKLFEALLDYCYSEGIQTVRSLVEERNNNLMKMVERLGFQRSNVINFDKTFES